MLSILTRINEGGFDKEVLTRFLVIMAIIVTTMIVAKGVMEELIGPAIAVVAIALSLTSSLPRWFMIWYERRNFLIEATFSGLFYYLSGAAGGIGFVTFSALVAGIVSVCKLINNRVASVYGRSAFQWLATKKMVYWILGSAPGPLDNEWRWPSNKLQTGKHEFLKQGVMDWKFLYAHWLNRHDPFFDYFMGEELPDRPSVWLKLRSKKRYYEQLASWHRTVERQEKHTSLLGQAEALEAQIATMMETTPTTPGERATWIAGLAALQTELDNINAQIKEV